MIDWQAMWLTLRLAVIVAAVLAALGLPLAYWITFSRWPGKFLVEAVVALPIILPPTVLGFYLLVAFGSQSAFGRWWQALTGHPLAFTFTGLVIGSIIYSLPFAVQPFASAFALVDRSLLAASATLGAGKWRTFWRIIFPLSLPGVVTGVALSFAHTVGEFGVVLMIGGNIPGTTKVLSVAIFDYAETSQWREASILAGGMALFAFVVILSMTLIEKRVARAGR